MYIVEVITFIKCVLELLHILKSLFLPLQLVLALYPQTTCFYRAIIHEQPKEVSKLNCNAIDNNLFAPH